ncbi:MAG: PKD domain-containing protein [Phaeodactylibacter sp.]|nr:PKD domain-containing protein [Phaeodactylibacter sp.]
MSCGETVFSTTIGESNNFNNNDYNCLSNNPYPFDAPDKIFKFIKTSNSGHVGINLFNQVSDLDIFVLNQCNSNGINCFGSSTQPVSNGVNHDFIIDGNDPWLAGTYYIVVDGYTATEQRNFDLTVTCGDLVCIGAEEIQCGETKLNENNFSAPNNVSIYNYQGNWETGLTGRERVFFFTLDDPQEVTIDLFGFSSNQDFELFLFDQCDQFAAMRKSRNPAGVPEQIVANLSPGTYYIVVEGYHGASGSFDLSVNWNCCPTTVINDCNDILVYPNQLNGNLSYRFQNTNSQVNSGSWSVNGQVVGTGNNLDYTFSSTGTYDICFEYIAPNGCPILCCRTTCITAPTNCSDITYVYNQQTNSFDFDLVANTSNQDISWINTETGNILSSGSQVSIPVTGVCRLYYLCAVYEYAGCYYTCSITFWLCDPYDCNDIVFAYNGLDGGYDLSLNNSNYSQATWYNDNTGNVLETGGSVFIPIGGGCIQYNATVRYYDSLCNCWRVCCISFWLCDPYACGLITSTYDPNTGYELTLGDPDATSIMWFDDTNGEALGSGSTTTLSLPAPGDCEYRYISARFWDGIVWRICCYTIYVCNTNEPNCFSLCDDWIINELTSLSSFGCDGPNLSGCNYSLFSATYQGQEVVLIQGSCFVDAPFMVTQSFNKVFSCSGNLLESCSTSFGSGSCAQGDGSIYGALENIEMQWTCTEGIPECTFDEVVVIPGSPQACDEVIVNVSGEFPDPCYSIAGFSYQIDGNAINIFIETQRSGGPCLQVITPWEISVPIGTLPEGTYTVNIYRDGAPTATENLVVEACAGDIISFPDDDYNACDEVTILVSGEFPNSCYSIAGYTWAVDGLSIDIFIDTEFTLSTCLQVIVPWEVSIPVGMLPSGVYTVTAYRNGVPSASESLSIAPCCEAPSAEFTYSIQGNTVQFENTSTGDFETFLWDFGNGTISTEPNPQVSFSAPGDYLVCLTVEGSCGSATLCEFVNYQGPSDMLSFTVGEGYCAAPGETVQVPILVNNFTATSTFQFTLRVADPGLASISDVIFQNLPGIPAANVSTNGETAGVVWFSGTPESITDNTEIMLVSLQLAQSAEDCVSLFFDGSVVSIYAESEVNGQSVPVQVSFQENDICVCSTFSVCGQIMREDGAPVGNVAVTLLDDENNMVSVVTGANGQYCFEELAAGQDYSIIPIKDINHLNGVNSGDLFRIQRHILQIEGLGMPYQRIAANSRQPNDINSGDLAELQRLILGIIQELQDFDSWRFVPADYVFPNPENPFLMPFPERIVLNGLSAQVDNANFVGIKIGDVNGSNDPGNRHAQAEEQRFNEALVFWTTAPDTHSGDTVTIEVQVSHFQDVFALQYSLGWDPDKLRFISFADLHPALNLQPTDFNHTADHSSLVWFNATPVSITDSSTLLSMRFEVIGMTGDSAEIRFEETPVPFYAEGLSGQLQWTPYNTVLYISEVASSTESSTAAGEWIVAPNPSDGNFRVYHTVPNEEPVSMELRLVDGQLLRIWEDVYGEAHIQTSELPAGHYYLIIRSADGITVRKLVLIRD